MMRMGQTAKYVVLAVIVVLMALPVFE